MFFFAEGTDCSRVISYKSMNCDNLNSNKMDISDKVNHRTHHTRFFEKLYGNLEKSSEVKKDEVSLVNQHDVINNQRESLTSPSESSGSSSEIFANEMSSSRCLKVFF